MSDELSVNPPSTSGPTVQYALSEADFTAGLWHVLRGQVYRTALLYLFAAGIALVGWFIPSRREFLPLYAAVVFACIGLSSPFFARRRFGGYYRRNPMLGRQTRATFSPEGLWTESVYGYSLSRWHGFTHFSETPALLLLHIGPQNPICIPKRAFEPSQWQEAMEVVRREIRRTRYAAPVPAFPVSQDPASDVGNG